MPRASFLSAGFNHCVSLQSLFTPSCTSLTLYEIAIRHIMTAQLPTSPATRANSPVRTKIYSWLPNDRVMAMNSKSTRRGIHYSCYEVNGSTYRGYKVMIGQHSLIRRATLLREQNIRRISQHVLINVTSSEKLQLLRSPSLQNRGPRLGLYNQPRACGSRITSTTSDFLLLDGDSLRTLLNSHG